MIHGLYLYGRHVGLNEPGNGIIKVVIQDTPTEQPNDVVKAWVEQYDVIRNSNGKLVSGMLMLLSSRNLYHFELSYLMME